MALERRHLVLPLLLASATVVRANDDIEWLGSYQEARLQARRTGKPILVEFRCEA